MAVNTVILALLFFERHEVSFSSLSPRSWSPLSPWLKLNCNGRVFIDVKNKTMKLTYNCIAGKDPHDILMDVSECVLMHARMHINACMHVCMNHHVSAKSRLTEQPGRSPGGLGQDLVAAILPPQHQCWLSWKCFEVPKKPCLQHSCVFSLNKVENHIFPRS